MSLLDELLDDYPNCQKTADKEGEQSRESEEMHRFFAECAQEPQGQQVQESVDESFDPEFALAVFPFLVVDGLFSYFVESGILGKIRNVSVHFPVHFYVFDHFIAVCLESAVHVVEAYARDFSCGGVV